MKSKIRQFIACAATFIMVSMSMEAQTSPVYSVPSPEAANLGTYGSVPVSLFTGIPDISVPIHEMRVGSMTFPVSLRYHLASVKPNQYQALSDWAGAFSAVAASHVPSGESQMRR